MGHYRSEMGFDAEDEAAEKRAAERKRQAIEKLKTAIAEDGIESVLHDIIKDPTMARIQYR